MGLVVHLLTLTYCKLDNVVIQVNKEAVLEGIYEMCERSMEIYVVTRALLVILVPSRSEHSE